MRSASTLNRRSRRSALCAAATASTRAAISARRRASAAACTADNAAACFATASAVRVKVAASADAAAAAAAVAADLVVAADLGAALPPLGVPATGGCRQGGTSMAAAGTATCRQAGREGDRGVSACGVGRGGGGGWREGLPAANVGGKGEGRGVRRRRRLAGGPPRWCGGVRMEEGLGPRPRRPCKEAGCGWGSSSRRGGRDAMRLPTAGCEHTPLQWSVGRELATDEGGGAAGQFVARASVGRTHLRAGKPGQSGSPLSPFQSLGNENSTTSRNCPRMVEDEAQVVGALSPC